MSENSPRIRELLRKSDLTESETSELRELLKSWESQVFEICPICGGSFSLADVTARTYRCPVCSNDLGAASGELLPHQRFEIDDSCEEVLRLGEYGMWTYPIGCTPCACGVDGANYYPASYTCCPSLLVLAGLMYSEGNQRAYDFLCQHQHTLLNALRGRYQSMFNKRHLKLFCRDKRSPECGPPLLQILKSIAGRE